MNHSDETAGTIANMAGIQTAIANHEADQLEALLGEQKLDALQKDYLLDLAKLSDGNTIQQIIKNAAEK